MTLVEFDKKLSAIDFNEGINIQRLDDYLLACLFQLELCQNNKPSYELFLLIFNEARNCPKMKFDSSWKELDLDFDKMSGRQKVINHLRFLTADLINTREIRCQPNTPREESMGEWTSEGGIEFYNGTTPHCILSYGATRFENEYFKEAFQELKVKWEGFISPIWIGISYE